MEEWGSEKANPRSRESREVDVSEHEISPDVGGVATANSANNSLTVTDNRTGREYEVEITDGTIRTMDLRQIKVDDDDFGLMGYDPAFTNTASCRSSITFIDGEAGILQHRGIPIEQLCEKSTFLEVAFLLVYGELPTQPQLERWVFDITHHTFVHENIKKFVEGFRYDAHPMGMLLASVGALSTFYPAAKHIDDPEERYMAAIRMIAKVPTLAAFSYRHNMGLPYVYPDNDLSYSENFLSMMFKKTEVKYQPDPRLAKALDVLFILHADHEQNCSTNAVRSVGSSQVDPYSAVAAGVAALYGPLHGGANEAVLRMLRRIETIENIPDFLERVKSREEKLMGFGHRVYKNYDPRARIIRKHVDEVLEATGDNPLLDLATELEKRALDDEYFTSRKLYPNVDFYSGLIYEALEIPTDMFTTIFAIPRTAGWIAQWLELVDDSEQKIARPRQIYTGARDADYIDIGDREGPEKITNAALRRPVRSRRGA
jgi:citrate synthase